MHAPGRLGGVLSAQSHRGAARWQCWLGRGALVGFCIATMMPRTAPAGTVAEQRARLPPPAECRDSIVGRWKSHDFKRHRGMWEIFTLEIRRSDTDPNKLKGTISNHYWNGGENDAEPGLGCPQSLHVTVSMDAEGTITGPDIRFEGVGEWRQDEAWCGDTGAYVLDVFEGRLDAELQEFQAVLNDGVVAINERTVLRRIGCLDDDAAPAEPKVVVKPPAFYPPEEREASGGCNGG